MLNDNEIDRLQILLRDDLLLATVKKVFDKTMNQMLPCVGGEDNQVIGEKYRAYTQAIEMIDDAFAEIEAYRAGTKQEQNFNRAR